MYVLVRTNNAQWSLFCIRYGTCADHRHPTNSVGRFRVIPWWGWWQRWTEAEEVQGSKAEALGQMGGRDPGPAQSCPSMAGHVQYGRGSCPSVRWGCPRVPGQPGQAQLPRKRQAAPWRRPNLRLQPRSSSLRCSRGGAPASATAAAASRRTRTIGWSSAWHWSRLPAARSIWSADTGTECGWSVGADDALSISNGFPAGINKGSLIIFTTYFSSFIDIGFQSSFIPGAANG